MIILMLAQFYPPIIGGEERHVRNLSVELAARGHEVHVGTLRVSDDEPVTSPDGPGVTVHRLTSAGRLLPRLYSDPTRPMAMPMPDPILVRSLHSLSERVRPQVVHAHNWIVNSYLPIKHRVGAPLVLSLHDYSHVCATKRLMFHDSPCPGPSPRRCLPCSTEHYSTAMGAVVWPSTRLGVPVRNRRVDVFTPVSAFVATASGLEPAAGSQTEVVPNFVPDDLAEQVPAEPDPRLPERPFYFFAGDLSAQKGLLTLLAAYDRLPPDRAPLLLVGRPTPDLPDTLPAGVIVEHGWEHGRVLGAFARALCAVLPSEWNDPCPTTVLEALQLGTPVITTLRGGIADMVRDEVSALVTVPGDPASLHAALARMAAEPALRASLADGGRQAVKKFRRSAVADQLERIYLRLDAARPRR